ncbi:response regulator [Gracilinema caldarium]|uniref:Response regulator receiver protein n=1 Tax=Gracilinema caldarium (strain ATCC 51460 / DSM 7334 / H1) TaxID=744872 RepID=F8F3T8_GRAC1|nr:response regulator [Gracilinema caldarium]AEJ20457.1 response regulator receiver protein [Gracilinema caldarium DSM 7334]
MVQHGSILLVEDDLSQQEYLEMILERLDISADIAGTKKEAQYLLETSITTNSPYKLIILDILLPDGTGSELLQMIRTDPMYKEVYQPTKIIMLTALDDLKYTAGSFAQECDFYLTKPIQKEQFLSLLNFIKIV